MAMFTAYFDESGTHGDSSNVVMGGYIAEVVQWTEFAREWSRMKAEEDVEIFHRVEMEHFRGEFENWSRERLAPVFIMGMGLSTLHLISELEVRCFMRISTR